MPCNDGGGPDGDGLREESSWPRPMMAMGGLDKGGLSETGVEEMPLTSTVGAHDNPFNITRGIFWRNTWDRLLPSTCDKQRMPGQTRIYKGTNFWERDKDVFIYVCWSFSTVQDLGFFLEEHLDRPLPSMCDN